MWHPSSQTGGVVGFSLPQKIGRYFFVREITGARRVEHLFRAIWTRDYQIFLSRIWCLDPIDKLIEVRFENRRFETALPDHGNPPSHVL